MTTVYLARHGRTAWNREEVFRGLTDVPLDEVGRQQAAALGKALKGRTPLPDLVVCSPLSRAKETALIAVHEAAWETDAREEPAFRDLHFGSWEGLTRHQVAEKYPDLYRRWSSEPDQVEFPGGESLSAVLARSWGALTALVDRHPGKSILVVTHRVVCKVLLGQALGAGLKAFWRIRQDTACLNVLNWHGSYFEVLHMNDTSHLSNIARDLRDF